MGIPSGPLEAPISDTVVGRDTWSTPEGFPVSEDGRPSLGTPDDPSGPQDRGSDGMVGFTGKEE